MITTLSLLLLVLIFILLKMNIITDIFNPGILFSFYWLIQVLVVSTMLDYPYKNGYYLILLFASVAIISTTLAEKVPTIESSKKNIKKTIFFNTKLNKYILIFTVVLGCLFEVLELRSRGMSIFSIFDFQSLLDLNKSNAFNRYYGEASSSGGISKILLVFVYFSPVVGGIHFNFSNTKKEKFLSFLSFLPAFISMAAENTKSGMVAAFFLFASSFIISFILKEKKVKIKIKHIIIIVSAFVVSMYMFIISMVLRTGQFTKEMFVIAQNKIYIYALGHIPAFSYWFSNENHEVNGIGKYTFFGVYNFLGLADREQGVYKDAVIVKGIPTNIYTVFRGLITDYSLVGTYFFIFLIVFVATISYKNLKKQKAIYINSFILLNFYFFTFYSFLISSWTYTSYIMVMFLFCIYILVVLKREVKQIETI